LLKYQLAGETACPTQTASCSQGLVAEATLPPNIDTNVDAARLEACGTFADKHFFGKTK